MGLEQRLSKVYEKRHTDLVARRRQDVRDQADEATSNSNCILNIIYLKILMLIYK